MTVIDMPRRKPPNRLVTTAIKLNVANAPGCYIHIDRVPGGRVEHIRITPSGRHGSDLQQLLLEISRIICLELQS